MRQLLVATLLLLLGACASTPSDHTSTSPTGIEMIPGCDDAKDPESCRREHKNNGSDVPTVDHHSPELP